VSYQDILHEVQKIVGNYLLLVQSGKVASEEAEGKRRHKKTHKKGGAPPPPTLRGGDSTQGQDGRLTPQEFERVLFDAGITWLNTKEIRDKFDAIDTDKSGKVNLGEVLSAATRMNELVRQVQEYEKEVKATGRDVPHTELLEEFGSKLLLGSDLVGSKLKPVIDDTKITASSYHLDREDHGKNSMWRSRLDCNETTWVADPVGLDKGEVWIQWDFQSMKTITAVQTRGRPNRDEWVTGYHLQYSTSTALDDHHDWKPCGTKNNIEQFTGNSDRDTMRQNTISAQFDAMRVRLVVDEIEGRFVACRATLLGFAAG
jgi:hypothetical protein